MAARERAKENTGTAPGNSNLQPPWQPGTSGNPQGRPPGSRNLKTILREHLEIVRKNETNPLKADEADTRDMTVGELLIANWIVKGLEGDWKAAEKILEHLEGKATQPLSGPEGGPIKTETKYDLSGASDDLVTAIAETMAKVKVG